MTMLLTSLSKDLEAHLSAGRVVRIGEASVLGRALICPDERRMDLVTVFGSTPATQSLALWVCHYPREVNLGTLADVFDAGLQSYAAAGAPGVPPHFHVFSLSPVLPDFAIAVSPARHCFALHLDLSIPPEHLALVYFLVSALETFLWQCGVPPRQVRRIRRHPGSAIPRGGGHLPLPAFLSVLLRPGRQSDQPSSAVAQTRGAAHSTGPPTADEECPRGVRREETRWRLLLHPVAAPPPLPATDGRSRRTHAVSPARKVVRSSRASPCTGELDLPATVARSVISGNAGAHKVARLRVTRDDLCFRTVPERVEVDRCLLLDASASMAGARTKAGFAMADFLLRNSRGRLALVAFRGDEAQVLSRFTRSRRQLRRAMRLLRPNGLTPLASGLMLTLQLVTHAHARRPQVILVTDGEPTRSLWTRSALADALTAARLLRESGIRLVCCGLAGNEPQLAELSRSGGGRLFVLRDFSEDSLLCVTRHVLG